MEWGRPGTSRSTEQRRRFFFSEQVKDNAKPSPPVSTLNPRAADSTGTVVDREMPCPRVSIIIPVFNKIEFTRACLRAVRSTTPSCLYEIIIVDNASTDGTQAFLKAEAPDTLVIRNQVNQGFAGACNQGAKAARGDCLLFLNNDTEPQPGWLEPLLHILDNDPEVAAVGSKLLYPDGTIQHAGILIVQDHPSSDLLMGVNAHQGRPSDYPLANHPLAVQALTAASLLIRTSAFLEAGGFDEEYWNGYEDVDICFKLREKGWRLVYQPASVVIHYESQSGPERFRRARQNIERLHSRWLEKTRPDLIIDGDGSSRETGAVLSPYLTRAEEPAIVPKDAESPLSVSIIILTWNQSVFTQECIASIERHTPEPHEVIIVDNGSTDGTVPWLRELLKSRPRYSLIENSENLGFSHGCNQGIEASRGNAILLLNNDTIVTPGWLSGLLECLNSSPDVGAVGPMTNSISGIQMVPAVGYADIAGLDGYALEFREKYRGRRIPLRRIVGFCMLFRRELVERIGLLDERFGSGNFEDDDYCLRAALEGYRNLAAGDVFIHHHGSASFRGNGIDFTNAMTGNHSRFNEKWGGPFTDEVLAKKILTLKTLEKAELAFHRGEPDLGVETILHEGIKLIPGDERFYLFLAEKLIDEKRYQDALGVLGETPAMRRKELMALLSARAHEGIGDIVDARMCLDDVNFPPDLQAQADLLSGRLALREGDAATAEAFFLKATGRDPGCGEAFSSLGAMAFSDGRTEQAISLLEQGFNICPTSPASAEHFHGLAAQQPEYLDRGISAFREAARLFPFNRRITFLLIDLLIKKGTIEEALAVIQKAITEFGLPEGLIEASLPLLDAVCPVALPNQDDPAGVSVCMIAKNEEENLPRCLSSILPFADEIIIVDTGSDDRTRQIARIFGAKVFDFQWNGDFSAARNESLRHASCSWILIMDADEVVSPLDHHRLKVMLKENSTSPKAIAVVTRNYMLQVNREKWQPNDGGYPLEEAAGGWVPSTKVRIFPNRMGIVFENPIHEIVEPSLERIGIHVIDCDIPVHHYGFLDEARTRDKKIAYYEMGMKKLAGKGEDMKALYELAVQASEISRHEEAVELWKRALEINPEMEAGWFNLGYNLLMLCRFEESRKASMKALDLKSDYREATTNLAMCELCLGNSDKAVSLMDESLKNHMDDPNTILMAGVALACLNKVEDAREYFKTLRQQRINYAGFANECAEKLIVAGKQETASLLLQIILHEDGGDDKTRGILKSLTV